MKKRFYTTWVVYPDDPDIPSQSFRSESSAKEWAAGLCCGSWIESVCTVAGW